MDYLAPLSRQLRSVYQQLYRQHVLFQRLWWRSFLLLLVGLNLFVLVATVSLTFLLVGVGIIMICINHYTAAPIDVDSHDHNHSNSHHHIENTHGYIKTTPHFVVVNGMGIVTTMVMAYATFVTIMACLYCRRGHLVVDDVTLNYVPAAMLYWLSGLKCFTDVSLNHINGLDTALPPQLQQPLHLRKLDLRHNGLTTIPPWLLNMTELEVLDVRSNALTALPHNLGHMTSLRQLYVDDTVVSYPNCIVHMTQLQGQHWIRVRRNLRASICQSLRGCAGLAVKASTDWTRLTAVRLPQELMEYVKSI